jgi:hypothetical protein
MDHGQFRWFAFYRAGCVTGDATVEATELTARLTNPMSLPFLMLDMWNPVAFNYFFALRRHAEATRSRAGRASASWQEWTRRNPLEVFGMAMAWEEHSKEFTGQVGRLTGPAGALFLAHAAYATLMAGLVGGQPNQPTWEKLLKERDQHDPLIQFSYLLYELCLFKESTRVTREMNRFLADCPPECRAVLESAGWLSSDRPTVRFGKDE